MAKKHAPSSLFDRHQALYFKGMDSVTSLIAAFEAAQPRWERSLNTHRLAVKYHATPAATYFLDQFVERCAEELWARAYRQTFFETNDDRKACKAGDEAAKEYLEKCK